MNKFLEGNYGPIFEEGEFDNITDIIGEIPKELNGMLYRNGPNPQFPNDQTHWFEGDGMIHAFKIADGKISYRNRWVQTERFKLERQAGKALFGYFGTPLSDEVKADYESEGTANTNIIRHANKLLALQEGSAAIEINPSNLNTLGKWDYQGDVPQMSAHPHFDYQTGEMLNFAYTPFSNEIIFYAFNSSGRVAKIEKFDGPYSCFMHDFFITKNYALFLFLPLAFNQENAQQGKPAILWEPDLGSHIAIMPRNGTAKDIMWFNTDPFHAYHYMNAYEEGNKIILDGMKSPQAGLFPDKNGKIPNLRTCYPKLTRWTFDLQQKKVSELKLDSRPAEFPRFDERYTGIPYQHGYTVGNVHKILSAEFNAIIHYDLKTQKQKICKFGIKNSPSEPVFVPRNKNSAEGDGFILTVVFQAAKNTSDLYILDAMNIDKEPLAIVHLPHRIPFGFHGNWYED